MQQRFVSFILFFLFLLNLIYVQAQTVGKNQPQLALRKAQAVRPDVEIFQKPDFDSDIIQYIQPGKYYFISNSKKGPFFKIRIDSKTVGYIADSEVDIEGEGRIQATPFLDDPEAQAASKSKRKTKKIDDEDEEYEREEFDDVIQNSYHGIILSLINYREDTMGEEQVSDLYSIGYRYIPYLSDYTAAISWDVNLSLGVPSYYKEKLNTSGSGFTAWSGVQFLNISVIDHSKTLRYGVGPFLKAASYHIQAADQGYNLQELTLGMALEGGFVYHTRYLSYDFGLRYYWEKQSYGAISFGFLF